MKKLKLIFGLLIVAGFVATVLISNNVDEQAIKKGPHMILPTRG